MTHLRQIIADTDLSSWRGSIPPASMTTAVYDQTIGAGDQWQAPAAHTRPGRPCQICGRQQQLVDVVGETQAAAFLRTYVCKNILELKILD
jgi:hypothetical protein